MKWLDVISKFCHWTLFNVLFSCLPIGLLAWRVASTRQIDWPERLANGDLLLVATSIVSSALGEMISRKPSSPGRSLLIGVSFLFIMTAVFCFADVSARADSQATYDKTSDMTTSVVVFVVSIILSSVCIVTTLIKMKSPPGKTQKLAKQVASTGK